jgi:uncharacterized protein YjbI with pentapeptide repeats
MKVVKHLKVGLLTRSFEYGRRFHLGIATIIGFRFDRSVRLLSEVAVWKLFGEELGGGTVLDGALPKSRSEFLVSGSAFAPGGAPASACPVTVRVGEVEKTLSVVGDRHWVKEVPTQPVPFTRMELTWERAFGGPGLADNPVGRGHAPIERGGLRVHPLPNVERAGALIRSPADRPAPAGFLPFGLDWAQVQRKLGTYDQRWFREEYPGFASDIDWTAFNVAPTDQQQAAAYVGDETFTCVNMHPEKPSLDGQLPGIQTRCFVTLREPSSPLAEVAMQARTLWLFPHREVGFLVFHGAIEVGEDDAADVREIMVAAEDLGRARPVDHYEAVLARSRGADGLEALFKNDDLVPKDCIGSPELDAESAQLSPVGLARAAQRRRAEREHAQKREQLVRAGVDPDKYLPAELPSDPEPPRSQGIAAIIANAQAEGQRLKAEAKERGDRATEEVREVCRKHNIDYDSLFASPTGPPKFSAEQEHARAEAVVSQARGLGAPMPELEAFVADPRYRQRLSDTERQLRDAYRRTAHHAKTLAPRLEGAALERARAEFLELVRAREPMSGRDFSGVDLSGLDLSRANLSGVFLESGSLAGTNLSDCNLGRAVLAGADLEAANLNGADLSEANLGKASLRRAFADTSVNLKGAILDKTDVRGARLRHATMTDATLHECILEGADLSGAVGENVVFYKCPLTRAKLNGAVLSKATFVELDARELEAAGATLEAVTLYDVCADNARLVGARLSSLRAVGKTSMMGADLSGAIVHKACLRTMNLRGARLDRTDASGSDLSEANLAGASLNEMRAHGALFVRTDFTQASLLGADLRDAILSKADLTGADLSRSCLHGADFARVRSDGGTRLDGAITTRLRTHPVRKS